jgi:hypothetical protein
MDRALSEKPAKCSMKRFARTLNLDTPRTRFTLCQYRYRQLDVREIAQSKLRVSHHESVVQGADLVQETWKRVRGAIPESNPLTDADNLGSSEQGHASILQSY